MCFLCSGGETPGRLRSLGRIASFRGRESWQSRVVKVNRMSNELQLSPRAEAAEEEATQEAETAHLRRV